MTLQWSTVRLPHNKVAFDLKTHDEIYEYYSVRDIHEYLRILRSNVTNTRSTLSLEEDRRPYMLWRHTIDTTALQLGHATGEEDRTVYVGLMMKCDSSVRPQQQEFWSASDKTISDDSQSTKLNRDVFMNEYIQLSWRPSVHFQSSDTMLPDNDWCDHGIGLQICEEF